MFLDRGIGSVPYDSIARLYNPMFKAFTELDPNLNRDINLYEFFTDQGHNPEEPSNKYLVVGCGTGRTAIPLLHKNFMITGVDISSGMLNEFRNDAADYLTSRQLTLYQHDFSNGQLPSEQKFDGVFVPGFTLNYVSENGQQRFLENIRAAMTDNSRIVVDLFYPGSLADPTISHIEMPAVSFTQDEEKIDLYVTQWMEGNREIRKRKFIFKHGNAPLEENDERVYLPPLEAKNLLMNAGFKNIQLIREYDPNKQPQDFEERIGEYNYTLVGYN